ncbi:hypothetical protein [Nesterenkonia sp. E16_7]|nr:hypothetical protein [Nesterenkonia sp. E16_7]
MAATQFVWSYWWLFAVGAFIAQIWAALREACEAFYEIETEADERVVRVASRSLSENLRQVQSKVAELSQKTPAKRPEFSVEVANLVVGTILGTYKDLSGARVTVFLMEENHWRTEPLVSRGRADQPRPFLNNTDARSEAFYEWALGNDKSPRFESDTELSGGHPDKHQGGRYRTYVSALIYNSLGIYGMLSVDAAAPASIDEEDKHLIQAFAGELATAFTIQRPDALPANTKSPISKRNR